MQRVRVGMTGLAAVILLIFGTSALSSFFARRDAPVTAVGASNASVVANLTGGDNMAAERSKDEPLAELGVAPGTVSGEPSASELAREQAHRRDAAGK
jgi:hypothetical protein